MDEDSANLTRNPLIADQTTDTLYAVACVLEALQAIAFEDLTDRGQLGVHLVLDSARRALLSEANH